MRRYVLAGFLFAIPFGFAAGQETVAPPTLMPAFTGNKAPGQLPSAALPGSNRPVTLTPIFEMPKFKQPKPAPGMELKPEHGEWIIELKSYAQIESGPMAQALAQEVREKHKAPIFLYEYGAEVRAKRDAEEAEARRRMEEELKPFFKLQAEQKAIAEAEGREFIETPLRTKVPMYYKEIPDQYMVVLVGFKDIDAARKALDTVRRWPMPKDNRLLDSVETTVEKNGKNVYETRYVNPFAEAKVVRNMTWPKQQVSIVDEFLIKLNEGEPMSILKSPKKWTVLVKSFNVPVTKGGQDSQPSSTSRGPMAGFGLNKAGKWLDATAQQAEEFCRALRTMKDGNGRSAGFDAHLMHHRTGTIVTVGQYDSADDPKMAEDIRRVQSMSFDKNENKNNKLGTLIAAQQKLFDGAFPMLIPK